jgi:glutamyl-tRNA synthetase
MFFDSKFTPDTAWRIAVSDAAITFQDELKGEVQIFLEKEMGDFVVKRKDGIPAYQIASLSDDLRYDINLIVRGEDLITSTAAQVYLSQLLDSKEFKEITFLHHPLLYENSDRKMSKSHDSLSIKAIRETMPNPKPIFQWIAQQLGFSGKASNLQELLEEFDFKQFKINKTLLSIKI